MEDLFNNPATRLELFLTCPEVILHIDESRLDQPFVDTLLDRCHKEYLEHKASQKNLFNSGIGLFSERKKPSFSTSNSNQVPFSDACFEFQAKV